MKPVIILESHPPIETRHDGNQGNLTPLPRPIVIDDGERVMAVQYVIDTHVQFLGMAGLEFEIAAKIQPDVCGHLVVVHGGEIVQGVFLPKERQGRILTRSHRLPVAGMERE